MDSDDDGKRDSSLRPHDPFKEPEREWGEGAVRPDFNPTGVESEPSEGEAKKATGSAGRKASDVLKHSEEAATAVAGVFSGGAGGGFVKVAGAAKGLYRRKLAGDDVKKKKGKAKKFSLAFVIAILLFAIPMMLLFSNLPAVLVYTLDISMQGLAGFHEDRSLLEKQSIPIMQEALLNGEVPEEFAGRLAEFGVEVGQTTLAGDFVRTNVYLADLDQDTNSVASVGNYERNGGDGELVVRFKDRIIKAADFVATVESDLELYAEYSEAADDYLFTKYMYSTELEKGLKEAGISRNIFDSWVRTGDEKKDQESFEELFYDAIDQQSVMYVNGYRGGSGDVDRGDGSEADESSNEADSDSESESESETKSDSENKSESETDSEPEIESVDNETSRRIESLSTVTLTAHKATSDAAGTSNDSNNSGSKIESGSNGSKSNNSSNSGNSSGNNSNSERKKNANDAANNISNYELLEGYGFITFYPPDADQNGGYEGQNGYDAINGNRLADGQAARDTRDGGVLNYGDIVYVETTDDPNAEGSYANGKYFIIADTGGETHGEGKWDLDIFVNENESRTHSAPYGQFNNHKVYKVASGVSWEEYLEKYHDAAGGSVNGGGSRNCSNGGVIDTEEGFTVDVKCDADIIVKQVGTYTTGDDSTKKGAQLLNVAVSATEKYKAGSAYVGTLQTLQGARIFGNSGSTSTVAHSRLKSVVGGFAAVGQSGQSGDDHIFVPINQLLTLFNTPGETTYTDAVTQEKKTVKQSVFENANFSAAVSGGTYDVREAQSFQRDSILLATRTADKGIINSTTLATNGQKKSNAVLKIGSGDSADMETLSKATDSVSIAVSQKAADIFKGVVGGNWLTSAGRAIFGEIDQHYLGRRPADAATIQAYNREVDSMLAKRAAAERLVKSPFDITSENTFLGSIMKNIASSIMANRRRVSNNFSMVSMIGAVSDLTNNSTKGILGTVVADGPGDDYADLLGSNCSTVNSTAGVEGDLYCTEHRPISTKYLNYTQADWDREFSKDDRKRAALLGNGRNTTVGIKDAEICEIYKKEFRADDESLGEQVWHSLSDLLSRMAGLYESCGNVDDSISLGGGITLSSQNPDVEMVEKASAYTLYDMTKALMYDKRSEMATIREGYYKEHPLDNSPEGRLARISGLSRDEVEIALNYADYLTVIANYNPATRYAFGDDLVDVPKVVEFIDDKEVESSVYLAWFSKIEYSDVRNRSFVV